MSFRVIPANAGNTTYQLSRNPVIGDHPRECGEHAAVSRADTLHNGSSPRMRGTPSRSDTKRNGCRIIPADAGNT